MNNFNNTVPVMVSTISGLTHSTIISSGQSAFLSNVPHSLMPIYTKVQLWYQWATTGFVPTWHTTANGIAETNIGVAITDCISRVLGGNVIINSKKEEIGDWFREEAIVSVINKAISFAVKGGTALVKLNREDGETYGEAFRVDNFIATADRKGKVRDAKIFVDYMESGKDNRKSGYWLVEHRYIENGAGKIRYFVSKSNISTAGDATKGLYTSYENCPAEVKEWLADHNITLDTPVDCDFNGSLGVFLLKLRDLGIDANNPYGESFINPILSDLYEYEYNEACRLVDLYTGRSRVMTTEAYMNNAAGPIAGLDNFLLLRVPNSSAIDAGKPEALQFDYRVEDHRNTKEEILESIASKLGISATTIGSYLKGDNSKTATEVSAETDNTARFAAEIRNSYIRPFILKLIAAVFGDAEVEVRFPTSGFTSLNVRMSQARDLYTSGLATVEQALQLIYPDSDKEELAKMAEAIKSETTAADEKWLKDAE